MSFLSPSAAAQTPTAGGQLPRYHGRSTGPGSTYGSTPARSAHPLSESVGGDELMGSIAGIDPSLDDMADGPARRSQRAPKQISRVVDQTAETVADRFEHFLNTHVDIPAMTPGMTPGMTPASSAPTPVYVSQVHGMRLYALGTLYVDFGHLAAYEDGVLASAVAGEYYRFQPSLVRALHRLVERHEPDYYRRVIGQVGSGPADSVVPAVSADSNGSDPDQVAATAGSRQFAVALYNLPLVTRLRQLRTGQIGRLLAISGTVTRTTEVRPELTMANFICQACNSVVTGVEQMFRYTEPTQCPNGTCMNRHAWRLDLRQSVFTDWQRVRLQENSSEMPAGSMPRTLDVILRGELVDRSKAGEKCVFTGTLIVVPDISQFRVPGVRAQAQRAPGADSNSSAAAAAAGGGNGVSGIAGLGVRDLTYKLAFLACMVTPDGLTGEQAALASSIPGSLFAEAGSGGESQQAYLASLLPEEIEELKEMVSQPNVFDRLVESIAPAVYGHELVKKGILLQLLGGVGKTTAEGMALRGDINVCVVGDPGTSKSQFLKYVTGFWPRSVYTSGKASSAAGLTAAVVKDEETGEFTIEAGALMLADHGICAIDEFDKMDPSDQVAIHEAMEQQTISIAKAGIHATLNARAAILAAANPVGGRYNRKASLRANVAMSAPILSRFDLLFVIVDDPNSASDMRLANHIVDLHIRRDAAIDSAPYSTDQLLRYIRFARTFRPTFTTDAKGVMVRKYCDLRSAEAAAGLGRNAYRITVRQLESIVRLSEAIAKANCVVAVTAEYVIEAYDLLRQSIITVEKEDVDVDEDEPVDGAGADGDGDDMMADTVDAAPVVSSTAESGGATKISYDKFRAVQRLIVTRLARDQTESEDGVAEDELLVWYLEQLVNAGDIFSAEQMRGERRLAKKVLSRLVRDQVVMRLADDGPVPTGGEEPTVRSQVVYVLHPNVAIEELT